LYLVADDGSNGAELWKSDGTTDGTVLVKDINPNIVTNPFGFPGLPGPASSSPDWLTDVQGTLYFSADDGTSGRELWKSDGTPEGTVLVKDVQSDAPSGFAGSANPANLIVAGGRLYFTTQPDGATPALWVSDGTPEGTVSLHDLAPLP